MLGCVEQHPNPVAQQVNCGLEAGREYQSGGGKKLLVAEAGACVAGLNDLTHQVAAGMTPQLVKVIGEPIVEALDSEIDPAILLPREADVQARSAQLTELEDAGTRLVGHP